MDLKLKRELLDFDRSRVRPEDCLISWKAIAAEMGISPDTLQRWCDDHSIALPHWGPFPRSPVYLPRAKVVVLRTLYFS